MGVHGQNTDSRPPSGQEFRDVAVLDFGSTSHAYALILDPATSTNTVLDTTVAPAHREPDPGRFPPPQQRHERGRTSPRPRPWRLGGRLPDLRTIGDGKSRRNPPATDGNALSGSEADNNGGPGFLIVSKSCCSGSSGQSFDTAAAFANQGPGIVYEARNDGSNCVGGTGPTCTGGTFFPLGFDTTPGGITVADNKGSCPPKSLPTTLGAGVCPIVLGNLCSASALNRCP